MKIRSHKITWAFLGLVTVLYGILVFVSRHSISGPTDHLKVMVFATLLAGWVFTWQVFIWPGFLDSFQKGNFGMGFMFRVGLCGLVGITVVIMNCASLQNPVWQELWNGTVVVWLVPVILSMVSALGHDEREPNKSGEGTA